MRKIFIIDGNNFFRRVFYNACDVNDFSKTLSGIITPFNVMRKNSLAGSDIIMTFDTCKSERRLKLYPEYKGVRKSSLTDEEREMYNKVFPAFINICKHIGLRVLEGDGYEADDYIAMLTYMLRNRYIITIISTDGDMPQLIHKNVSVYNPTKKITITEEMFENFFGIKQQFYVDMKAIVGDSSDNIIGVKGVGERTAVKYISQYGSFEDIIKELEEKPKLTKTDEKILNFDKIDLNRKLIDLSLVKDDMKLRSLVKQKVQSSLNYSKESLFKLLCEYDISYLIDSF